MGHKFYACLFENIKHPMPDQNMVFVKFGHTHHTKDVLRRFDPKFDDGYVKNYEDWKITCKVSIWFKTKAEAEALEQHYLTYKFPNPGPNKVWVEKYLGLEDNNYYYDNTGITELRLLTKEQASQVFRSLHEHKEKVYEHTFGNNK